MSILYSGGRGLSPARHLSAASSISYVTYLGHPSAPSSPILPRISDDRKVPIPSFLFLLS